MKQRAVRKRNEVLIVGAWAALVLIGFGYLHTYGARAGELADGPQTWRDGTLEGVAGRPRVLLFAHPRCSCTRASIAELTHVVEAHALRATVVFWQPERADAEWRSSPTIDMVQQHPLLDAAWDPGGKVCRSFDAATSGQCLVYDANGRLRFSGGITAGRGHEGANEGRQTVDRLLSESGDPPTGVHTFPVFGCRLEG